MSTIPNSSKFLRSKIEEVLIEMKNSVLQRRYSSNTPLKTMNISREYFTPYRKHRRTELNRMPFGDILSRIQIEFREQYSGKGSDRACKGKSMHKNAHF